RPAGAESCATAGAIQPGAVHTPAGIPLDTQGRPDKHAARSTRVDVDRRSIDNQRRPTPEVPDMTTRITRRRLLGAMGAGGALAAIPACKGGDKSGGGGGGKVKIGVVVPQSGVYATVGNELKRAWELWLERHGGKLGGREVTSVVADEGESPQTAVPA